MDATTTRDKHAVTVVGMYKAMHNSIMLRRTSQGVCARVSFGGSLPVTVAIENTEREAYRSAARFIRGR